MHRKLRLYEDIRSSPGPWQPFADRTAVDAVVIKAWWANSAGAVIIARLEEERTVDAISLA